MKTENIINLAVGGAVLFGAVWLVSKAWRKGQGNGQETMSEFRGKRAKSTGFAGLNRGVSPSGNVIKAGDDTYNCVNGGASWQNGTVTYADGTSENVDFGYFQQRICGRLAQRRTRS